jgi:hypothetical protein
MTTQLMGRGESGWARPDDYNGRGQLSTSAQNTSECETPCQAERLCASDNPNIESEDSDGNLNLF